MVCDEEMAIVSKAALGIAAGIFGTIFVGYCVYFDRQRRSDPDFKHKLRERRKAKKACKTNKSGTVFPDVSDHEAIQKFFLKEIELGEEYLGQGNIEEGVEHIGNAVAVCGQPSQLLQVLQQTLPPHVFGLLLKRIPTVSQKLLENPNGGIIEDEVE